MDSDGTNQTEYRKEHVMIVWTQNSTYIVENIGPGQVDWHGVPGHQSKEHMAGLTRIWQPRGDELAFKGKGHPLIIRKEGAPVLTTTTVTGFVP